MHNLGNLCFYNMKIAQNEDYTWSTYFDGKLQDLEQYQINLLRRGEFELDITSVGKAAFLSLDSSLGWLRIAASRIIDF